MPPIKVFTDSPINAAKPSGTTPQTSSQEGQGTNAPPPAVTSGTSNQAYPAPAQPGAAPSLPAPTGAASFNTTSNYHPTPTRALSGDGSGSPPPPQPGAVPVPPTGAASASSHIPPPPKAGEKYNPPSQGAPQVTTMPPQMSYSLPGTNAPPHSLGSSTSTAAPTPASAYAGGPARPTTLMEGGMGGSSYGQQQPTGYSQPHGGYQQSSRNDDRDDGGYDSQDESVWGTAKKWAWAAGDSLAKAENEVWKRINKD